jgi:hypothetical protein
MLKLVVFESLARQVSEASKFKPNHCKCKTVIRNGLIARYETPKEVVEFVHKKMDLRGRRPNIIETVGSLHPSVLKQVEIMKYVINQKE